MGRLIDEDIVIDIVNFECGKWTGLSKTIEKEIKALTPAQPDCTDCIMHGGDWECDHIHCRKGHWIKRFYTQSSGESLEMHVCSKCRQEYSYDAETGESEDNFCPNCGSDNRGKQK